MRIWGRLRTRAFRQHAGHPAATEGMPRSVLRVFPTPDATFDGVSAECRLRRGTQGHETRAEGKLSTVGELLRE